jgi:hypothetical protein
MQCQLEDWPGPARIADVARVRDGREAIPQAPATSAPQPLLPFASAQADPDAQAWIIA